MSPSEAKFGQVCLQPMVKDLGSISSDMCGTHLGCFIFSHSNWGQEEQHKHEAYPAYCVVSNKVLCQIVRSGSLVSSSSFHKTVQTNL